MNDKRVVLVFCVIFFNLAGLAHGIINEILLYIISGIFLVETVGLYVREWREGRAAKRRA